MPKSRGDRESAAIKRRVGMAIRACREKAGLQGQELAQRVGVRPSVVTDWEKGRRLPGVENLIRIHHATGESLVFILNANGYEEPDGLESLSRCLGATIGARRAARLLQIPDRRLIRALDAVIGEALIRTE